MHSRAQGTESPTMSVYPKCCARHTHTDSHPVLFCPSPAAAPVGKAQAEEVVSGQVWPHPHVHAPSSTWPPVHPAEGGHCHQGMEANPPKALPRGFLLTP